ncbi:hypothetical protein XA68_13768 [Ophiocordyceps unilateralis]|uniref:Uncharacterized protein n=1 Tax=Ophiocordyceps unilateralis TaxID=268505 RepID=A0A2A9PBU5_OPHUN|nr:hypothetical protein XA68_13768 [Ophiocordyceps unilateralis]
MALGNGISRAVARLLAYGDGTWRTEEVDLLQNDQILPDVCYVFVEDRDLYKRLCTEHDRGRILAPFNIPAFLASKLCTGSNGYFGCRSSFDPAHSLIGLAMWFRCLVKIILDPEECRAPDGNDYWWYEMGFFTSWCHPNSSKVLCVGTTSSFRDRLGAHLGTAPLLELRDPFAMLIPLFGQIIELYNDSTWRVRNKVRTIEKTRGRHRADFVAMHDVSRHAIHLNEVYTAAIESIENLLKRQETAYEAMTSLDKTYKLRASSNQERIIAEITLAYHIITSQDSAVMRTIGILTMTFLPASFVAALFGTTFFSSAEDKKLTVSTKFWTYWVVAVPSTLLVLLAWRLFLQKSSSRNRWS